MAGSRKSRRSSVRLPDLADRVAEHLQRIVRPRQRLVVALSGGIDSVVLLDTAQRAARRVGYRLSALHVNHGLSAHADRWAAFCRSLCRRRRIPLRVVAVTVPLGNSTEGAARAARLAALRAVDADHVLFAHNLDDQAETVLLQLLRGAGAKGLAAMSGAGGSSVPSRSGGIRSFLRPLLDTPRAGIAAYARSRRLAWIEDDSNADMRYLRNFLRRDILPRLERRVPGWRATLGRAAAHLAEAAGLLDRLAELDAARVVRESVLDLAELRRLDAPRARNLLRFMIASRGARMPESDRLDEALRQAVSARDDAGVRVDLGDLELRRFRGQALLVVRLPPVAPEFVATWRGEPALDLPELGGVLRFVRRRGAGVKASSMRALGVTVRLRQGGERLRPDARRPSRSVKNLLQEAGLPPWARERLPLVYCGGQLVCVPGIGIETAFQADGRTIGIEPVWEPASSGTDTPSPRARR